MMMAVWAIIVKDQQVWAELCPLYKKLGLEAQPQTLATQAQVLVARKNEKGLALIQLPDQDQAIEPIFQWISKTLFPTKICLTGRSNYIGLGQSHSGFLVPEICYRQVGRMDIGSAPILYEEIFFDAETQKSFQDILEMPPQSRHQKVFVSENPLKDKQQSWVFSHLNCVAHNTWMGQALVHFQKTQKTPVGCLEIFHAKDDLSSLCAAWTMLLSQRF